MRVEDSELLGEFLSERAEYSADLKAMVLLMVEKQQGNVKAVSEQTGVAIVTIYQWLSQWNSREKTLKKSLSTSRGQGGAVTARVEERAFADFTLFLQREQAEKKHWTSRELLALFEAQTHVRYSASY